VSKERIDAASRDATDTANVTIGSGALSSVGDVFGQSFGERTAVVVTDENAWAAGERVQRHLEAAGRETVEPYVFPGKPTLYADDWSIEKLIGPWRQRARTSSAPLDLDFDQESGLPDTIYVDDLVGPETVNTMPLWTLKATMDHAEVRPTLEGGVDEARELFEELREAGVDYDEVTRVLEKEAVEKFADSYRELMEEIEKQGRALAR
jgi:alkanesulfonate monooxygenase SsuD/methylene tetrahydromethanopterin reductase-like flavin-dependent oxidoreductase (luciferase family)